MPLFNLANDLDDPGADDDDSWVDIVDTLTFVLRKAGTAALGPLKDFATVSEHFPARRVFDPNLYHRIEHVPNRRDHIRLSAFQGLARTEMKMSTFGIFILTELTLLYKTKSPASNQHLY